MRLFYPTLLTLLLPLALSAPNKKPHQRSAEERLDAVESFARHGLAAASAEPFYVGCYEDGWPNQQGEYVRNLEIMFCLGTEQGDGNFTGSCANGGHAGGAIMTPTLCSGLCSGFKFFGVQFGGGCFCGNDFGNQGGKTPETDCNTPCNGDSGTMCGGSNRNSIYAQPPSTGGDARLHAEHQANATVAVKTGALDPAGIGANSGPAAKVYFKIADTDYSAGFLDSVWYTRGYQKLPTESSPGCWATMVKSFILFHHGQSIFQGGGVIPGVGMAKVVVRVTTDLNVVVQSLPFNDSCINAGHDGRPDPSGGWGCLSDDLNSPNQFVNPNTTELKAGDCTTVQMHTDNMNADSLVICSAGTC
eukprot:SAG25_NODE_434_length_8070_cov_90.584117_9_plen_360_part_00